MFKKILKSVDSLLKRSDSNEQKVTTVAAKKRILEQKYISKNALETINRLTKEGFKAYLVGGCIRDLLLNFHPKDFDVATNATPEEVRKIFRNSRVIGRRFKLVHVFWGREIIEVATFRGPHSKEQILTDSVLNSSGRILRDNVYGSIEEDAYRRDFTINALYYDMAKQQVLDYANGLDDIDSKVIRLIGSPQKRYQEDPVRMLRAVRFAAKLGFAVEADTEQAIYQFAHLLADIPAARLFDEVLKLFLSGKALVTYELLKQYNLFAVLFPMTAKATSQFSQAEQFIRQALINTDERLNQGKTVNPAFLYASFLWPALLDVLDCSMTGELPTLLELQPAANELIARQNDCTSIPKRFGIPIREIWETQIRLTKRRGKKPDLLVEHPRFRAGYDFLLLRESIGEQTDNLGQWWTVYQQADDIKRRAMMRELSSYKPRVRKRRNHKSETTKADTTVD